jgi:hypothetical protein
VSGTNVTVAASPTDDVGVTSVQFFIDGAPLGQRGTGAPYQATWDTTRVGNGQHVVSAQALDTLGNVIASAPVAVTVANTSAPTIATITPAVGTPSGGSSVTVTGTGFQRGATVTFGGLQGTAVTVVTSGTITVVTPAHDAGTVAASERDRRRCDAEPIAERDTVGGRGCGGHSARRAAPSALTGG